MSYHQTLFDRMFVHQVFILLFQGIGRFSVSGREGTAVAPAGKAFYRNESLNLNVVITWANAGWTTRENAR